MIRLSLCLSLLCLLPEISWSLNIVIPGGSGPLGKLVASQLAAHDVTILSRNSFLVSAPARVTEAFGWAGESFLNKNPHVRIRDWDGGDLLDIVGCDWMGWQDDALAPADVVINLVGGYTEQRTMATERIVRQSLQFNPNALQITVAPTDEDLQVISPGAVELKRKRIQECEDMVRNNCRNSNCVRLEAYDVERSCATIVEAALRGEEYCPLGVVAA